MYISLYRIILCTFLFLITDISACLVAKKSGTFLENLLNASISIPAMIEKDKTPYFCWCEQIQQSYQSYPNKPEDEDKDCLHSVFSMGNAFQFEPLKSQQVKIPSLLAYYQKSICDWKNIDIPNENHVTLFMHHIYLLDYFSPIEQKKEFDQLLHIYSAICKKWQSALYSCFGGQEGSNLSYYLIEGNKDLKACCVRVVERISTPLEMETVSEKLDVLIQDVLQRKHITPFQKELFFWYGFQLLSISSTEQNILNCIRGKCKTIKPQHEAQTWQQEVFEYFLQIASIIETNIVLKDKIDVVYSSRIGDCVISASTLQYFEKNKDNFFLKSFMPTQNKFDEIVLFYQRKVSIKEYIERLENLLNIVPKAKVTLIRQAENRSYELSQIGQKICDLIISVGDSSNESYYDTQDQQAMSEIKANEIVKLITHNRHIIATTSWSNLLCDKRYADLKHTDLEYNENQKKYIEFQEKTQDGGIISEATASEEQPNTAVPVLKSNKGSSITTQKLFLGGIGVSLVGLLGYLYYLQKHPEAYFPVRVQDMLAYVRSLLI